MTQSDDEKPIDPKNLRRPWTEGPDEEAPRESWLALGDDELLHHVETLSAEEDVDDRLIEIIQSSRHFFIRQEAAKRVRNRRRLFPFEDDRHIGQILVRYLTRREDVTYLERLVSRSRHVEVRAAAQVQLAQLWGRLGGPTSGPEGAQAPPPPVFEEAVRPPELRRPTARSVPEAPTDEEIEVEVETVDAFAAVSEPTTAEPATTQLAETAMPETAPAPPTAEPPAAAEEPARPPVAPAADEPAREPSPPREEEPAPPPVAPVLEAAVAEAAGGGEPAREPSPPREEEPAPPPVEPAAPVLEAAVAEAAAGEGEAAASPAPGGASSSGAGEGVDGSLLGWAVHFLVEQVWSHLDTRAARVLLLRTHAELLAFHPALSFFRVEEDAHVHVDLTGGARLPHEAVVGVAAWMAAFLSATRSTSPDLEEVDVRHSTRLMADALEQVGFYEAVRSLAED